MLDQKCQALLGQKCLALFAQECLALLVFGYTLIPPTTTPLGMRSVGRPSETGAPWPSLPQVPTDQPMSDPTRSIDFNTSGPLPKRLAERMSGPVSPSLIRKPSSTSNTKSPVAGSTCPPPILVTNSPF